MNKLNQLCSKLALFTNSGRITMLVYYIVDLAYQLHSFFAFASDNQLATNSVLPAWIRRVLGASKCLKYT